MNLVKQSAIKFKPVFGNFSALLASSHRNFCAGNIKPTGNEDVNAERYHAYLKTKKISKAMENYLTAAKEKAELLEIENAEFELGKRHLANMMGLDPDTMTQDDIDEAIKYLLPSGLFSPRSRPTMKVLSSDNFIFENVSSYISLRAESLKVEFWKMSNLWVDYIRILERKGTDKKTEIFNGDIAPPSYYHPPIKPADFAEDGRPFNDMFYTLRPNFYQHLYIVYEKIEKLNAHAKKITSENRKEDDLIGSVNLIGTTWPDKAELEKRFLERLHDEHVKQYHCAMHYLVEHPFAYLENDFIMSCRISVAVKTTSIIEVVTETKTDENGCVYAEAEARRKICNAFVRVYVNGTGKFNIDGNDLSQFFPTARECVLFPFLILDRFGQFDVIATTDQAGESTRAGAVRLGICKALCPFLTESEVEKLKLAGLLSRDIRRKERGKWNRSGARKKPKWKKR